MAKQGILFDPRFLESFAGQNILHSAKTAIIELVANCWDAGATRAEIEWPDRESTRCFTIEDNGCGMTAEQFQRRWRTLSYDRQREQGPLAEFPEGVSLPKRRAFGRNGIGRFAGFCFGDQYYVRTWREGQAHDYRVRRGTEIPIEVKAIGKDEAKGSGTKVFTQEPSGIILSSSEARGEIGMRFLMDPNFHVLLDGQRVTFADIGQDQIEQIHVDAPGAEGVAITVIDTQKTDRTTRQHGVAWHVLGRLVGDCAWRGTGHEDLIDGRRIAAKRYTFIVRADCLSGAVKPDWSGFDATDPLFQQVSPAVYECIREFFLRVGEDDRRETFKNVQKASQPHLHSMSLVQREKWKRFVDETQKTCPSISENDLVGVSTVLAKLQESDSKYALIRQLSDLRPDQLDDLHRILADWTLDMAKVVLDELRTRLKLLDELKAKIFDEKADEVQELQPLFQRGLWIFGPEFETIEFTSNERMTTVVQRLFKVSGKGSQNRPDFVVLPDGTAGFYSYPRYGADGGEIGVDRLVVLELKKAGVSISTEQKAQCWKYVLELYREGLLQEASRVTCFALGSKIDPIEASPRHERDGAVVIMPLDYSMVISRAKSRTHNLYDRVKNAPLFKDKLQDFLAETEALDAPSQSDIVFADGKTT